MGHEMGALGMPEAYMEMSPILPHPKMLCCHAFEMETVALS